MACKAAKIQRHAIERQFWAYVNKTDTCWLWTGYSTRPDEKGRDYGVVCINKQHIKAHRFSYELHHGPIPDGLSVLHTCDVPRCVNPAHLYAGTQKENIHDAINRGRFVYHKTPSLAERTHCAQGHPTAEWMAIGKGGRHYCRRCNQINNAKRYSSIGRTLGSPTLDS